MYLYMGWGIVLLFLYLNFYKTYYFCNKNYKKIIPVVVWRMVWKVANIVELGLWHSDREEEGKI